MIVHTQAANPAVLWSEPMETVWQMFPGGVELLARFKRPDITIPDRLFIGAVVSLPRSQRWGAISWLAGVYHISRETVYTIGKRAYEGLLFLPQLHPPSGTPVVVAVPDSSPVPLVAVTENRLRRTLLTFLLPGGVTIRPMQDCLDAAFDLTRSVGFISELINEDGRRAGEIVDRIDFSPLGEVVLARDETYFDDLAFSLSVEPCHHVITGGYVEEGCDAERWGVALQLDQSRGLQIIGLSEDGHRCYPASLREAELSVPVQKDVWHAGSCPSDGHRLGAHRAEGSGTGREARKTAPSSGLERGTVRNLGRGGGNSRAPGRVERPTPLLVRLPVRRTGVVDWRSGEIRDREINQWLLEETIASLRQLDHPRVRALVTFLDWLEVLLIPWQRRLRRTIADPQEQVFFQAAVARAWRLSRAVTNGHTSLRTAADDAQALVVELIADDAVRHELAEQLLTILERVIRTSCAAETVNSVLKPYLWVKRSFQSRETAQNFLNLFVLWYNVRVFKRGKRAGKSPFQSAGIKVYTPDGRETTDWLEALGYPAD